MKVPLQKYWEIQKRYLAPFKRRLVVLALLLISGIILQIVTPLIIERYINLATGGIPLQSLNVFFRTLSLPFANISTILRTLILLASLTPQDQAECPPLDTRTGEGHSRIPRDEQRGARTVRLDQVRRRNPRISAPLLRRYRRNLTLVTSVTVH